MKRLLLILFLSLFLSFPVYGADQKISELTDLAAKPASDDKFVFFDSSTGITKRVDYIYFEDIKNVNLYGGLTAAVASLSTTEVSLRINDSQAVTDNLSIPTTMQLVIDRGGDIAISAGKVLTVNGTIRAGSYQIFSGSGTVTFSGSGIEYGAWKASGTDAIRGKVIDLGRYAADAEASDTYAITLSPAPTAYYTGMVVHFYAKTINTGACTLNVNGLGAKTIKKLHDQNTGTGDIEAGQHVIVEYDGTYFQMQSQTASGTAGILGDNVSGRVMRRLYITIDNGTNAATIKAGSFSLWQGDANAEEDNLAKSGDTGNFALSASGSDFFLQVSGITGNCVTVLNGHMIRNASGTDMTVQLVQTSFGIQFTFLNATTAAAIDLTTAVDTGLIQVSVLYLTDV